MTLRRIIFWLHLMAGVLAATVILVMSLTGALLAFERQIIAFAEGDLRTVTPPASGAPRLSLDTLVANARAAVPVGPATSITLAADPTTAALINFGREQAVFVDPYTGGVRGDGRTTTHDFFRLVTDWHRWLGTKADNRDIGRAVTGACNAAFMVLVMSGLYLWWPRRWTRVALKGVALPSLTLKGKARDWNWHNAVGFWSAPVWLFITVTGLVISYPWAGDLIYTLTGSEPPPPQRPVGSSAASVPTRASLDALFATASRLVPHWRVMTIRLPQRGASQVTVMIEKAASLHPYPWSTLTLDAARADVVQWEPFAGYNLGRTIRTWGQPVHTGEAGGFPGQLIAALASAGSTVLVYTGLDLVWRRFRQFVRGTRRVGGTTSNKHHDSAPIQVS